MAEGSYHLAGMSIGRIKVGAEGVAKTSGFRQSAIMAVAGSRVAFELMPDGLLKD